MKKLFLTVALVAVGSLAFGQGTIQFNNGTLTKVTMTPTGGTAAAVPTTAGLMNYGVFFGTSSTSLSLLPSLGANSTANAGLIVAQTGDASLFPIAGTSAGDTVWMQIKGWTGSFGSDWNTASQTAGAYFGQTDIRQVTLGNTQGPATVIWQSASGTSANKFTPLGLTQVVPEPSTMALAGLGAAALLIFRRRK